MEVLNGDQFMPVFKIINQGEFLFDDWVHNQFPSETAESNETDMLGMRPVLITNAYQFGEIPHNYALWRDFPKPPRRPSGPDAMKPSNHRD